MQATITYLLTEQAQRDAMAATGQPVARKQSITVDVTAEDMTIMQVAEDGTPYLDLSRRGNDSHKDWLLAANAVTDIHVKDEGYLPHFLAPNPDVLALLRSGRVATRAATAAAVAKQQAEVEEREASCIARFLGGGEGMYRDGIRIYNPWGPDIPVTHPRAHEILAEIKRRQEDQAAAKSRKLAKIEQHVTAFLADPAARAVRLDSDPCFWVELQTEAGVLRVEKDVYGAEKTKALGNEARRRMTADSAAKEQLKQDYIDQWIAEHADADTQQQHSEGLLCRKAAVNLIAGAAFEAAGVPEKVPESSGTTCEDTDCPCCDTVVDCVPRRVYPAWRAMKAKIPEGFAVEFRKRRDCLQADIERYGPADDNVATAGPVYYVATVTMPHGPFTFERTVKLG